jgi:hypothetical protein
MLIEDADYFHQIVRRPVMMALCCLPGVMINAEQCKNERDFRLNQEQAMVVDKILKTYMMIMLEDDDRQTVAFACEAISNLAQHVIFILY